MTKAVLMREDRRWREEKREQIEDETLTQPHSHQASSKGEVKARDRGAGRLTLSSVSK